MDIGNPLTFRSTLLNPASRSSRSFSPRKRNFARPIEPHRLTRPGIKSSRAIVRPRGEGRGGERKTTDCPLHADRRFVLTRFSKRLLLRESAEKSVKNRQEIGRGATLVRSRCTFSTLSDGGRV